MHRGYLKHRKQSPTILLSACGCTTEEEISDCLEFTGNSRVNQDIPTEKLVLSAIQEYKKHTERIPLIDIIRQIQRRMLYQEAEKIIKKRNGTELENNVKKRVRKIIKTFLYEPSIESFAEDVRISESAGMKENCG